jgi:hypothetical protein
MLVLLSAVLTVMGQRPSSDTPPVAVVGTPPLSPPVAVTTGPVNHKKQSSS